MEMMDYMRKLHFDEGRDDCRPDVFTYTSVIDALAKQCSVEAAQQAERLLEEAEEDYVQTGDIRAKPNVRTYTSVRRSNPETLIV